jgi:hypothetical protein
MSNVYSIWSLTASLSAKRHKEVPLTHFFKKNIRPKTCFFVCLASPAEKGPASPGPNFANALFLEEDRRGDAEVVVALVLRECLFHLRGEGSTVG